MLETLDAAAVRRWCGAGLAALRAHQHEIDELNVYPVPDGDTGTNLVLTLTSAHEAVEAYLAGAETDTPPSGVPQVTDDAAEARGDAAARRAADAQAPDDMASDAKSGAEDAKSGAEDAKSGAEEAESGGEDAKSGGGNAPVLGGVMRRMARGALLGARGNSGVIVSQILRGMADTFATTVSARGADLARALRTASEAAYAAVARPVEGTVLSVAAAAAEGANRIKSDDLVTVARAAARSAAEALARTPQQLPVLARAGVVDAGGRGLVVLLDALVEALSTTDLEGDAAKPAAAGPPDQQVAVEARADVKTAAARADEKTAAAGADEKTTAAGADEKTTAASAGGNPASEDSGYEYEVQYLLDATPAEVEALKRTLDALGDSLVVVGTGEGEPPTWNVHVHVDDIGAAIEAGVVAGRPHRISVTRLDDRGHSHPEPVEAEGDGAEGVPGDSQPEEALRGAVVVAAGDGLTSLFAEEGAVVVGRNPSTAEMLAAIEATRARQVVLLPNDANTHAVAVSAAREAGTQGLRVSVVPTRSPVQALAALAVRDPGRHFDDDVIAMAEASGACRYGEVTTAAREALTVAGRCRPGDLLGLVDGEVHVIGTNRPAPASGAAPEGASGSAAEGTSGSAAGGRSEAASEGTSEAAAADGGGSGEDLAEVSRRLVDRMLGGGGELVTLVLGADAPPSLEGVLRAHIARVWPFVEVHCYAGGQPRYHLLVGVE